MVKHDLVIDEMCMLNVFYQRRNRGSGNIDAEDKWGEFGPLSGTK